MFKKIVYQVLKYGHNLDKIGKILLLIPGLKAWGVVVMAVDSVFDWAWAKEQKEKVNQKIKKVKEK